MIGISILTLALASLSSATASPPSHSGTINTALSERTITLADALLAVDVNTCVTLTADANVDVGTAIKATIPAGACICVDAVVGISAADGVTIVTSDGLTVTGNAAAKIAVGLQGGVVGQLLGGYVFATADACAVVDISLLNSFYTFAPNTQNCCARTCNPGFTMNAQGQCVSTTPTCKSNQILCNGQCYNSNKYTCASGMPVKTKSKRDSCGRFESCPAFGGWECIDVMTNIESCGGCSYSEEEEGEAWGQDCTSIPNVEAVTCREGKCIVSTCQKGYAPSNDSTSCEATMGSSNDLDLGIDIDQQAFGILASTLSL